jgi:hypothetical protein
VFAIVLLVAAAGLLVAMEWPRVRRVLRLDRGPHRRSARVGSRRAGAPRRSPGRTRAQLRLVESGEDDQDEFARSVERDLAELPTIDERDRR